MLQVKRKSISSHASFRQTQFWGQPQSIPRKSIKQSKHKVITFLWTPHFYLIRITEKMQQTRVKECFTVGPFPPLRSCWWPRRRNRRQKGRRRQMGTWPPARGARPPSPLPWSWHPRSRWCQDLKPLVANHLYHRFHVKEHWYPLTVVFQNAEEVFGRSLDLKLRVVGICVVFRIAESWIQWF